MRCFSILLSSHQYCWGPSRSLPSSSGATNKRGKTPCPGCEKTTVNTTEDSSRIWCSNRRYTFSYIRNTPFGGRTLTPGAVVTAFSTLVGYSVSIRSLGGLRLSPTVSIRRSKRWQPPLSAASPSSGNTPNTRLRVQHRPTKPDRTAPDSNGKRCRGTASPAAGQVSQVDHAGTEHRVIQ